MHGGRVCHGPDRGVRKFVDGSYLRPFHGRFLPHAAERWVIADSPRLQFGQTFTRNGLRWSNFLQSARFGRGRLVAWRNDLLIQRGQLHG
jgi:hypothetical protein